MKNNNYLYLLLSICCLALTCNGIEGMDCNTKENMALKSDEIYYNQKPYAQLRYFNDGICIRGFAIFYYETEKEVWINPKEGWTVKDLSNGQTYYRISDIEKIWNTGRRDVKLLLGNKVASKKELISSCSFGIKLSEDGDYISYKTRGLLSESSHKYKIIK